MKMSVLLRLLSAFICVLILLPTLCGCSFLFPPNDLPEEIFDPPYLENYYVNKHTPVAKSGGMTVYKYESSSSKTFTLGGQDYHGGIEFWNTASPLSLADIEFPLEGLYKNFSFVLSGNGAMKSFSSNSEGKLIYSGSSYALDGAYPTLKGSAKELEVGIRILIDGRVEDEFFLSSYDVAKRYTYDVTAAQTFEVEVVAGDDGFNIYMMEITVWEGDAKETGYVSKPAADEPVKLIRDIKPYLIPNGSAAQYLPNHSSGERKSIVMNGVEFEDAVLVQTSLALVGEKEESIYFDLEAKYKYLTFTAGGIDGADESDEYSAWLTVYADGKAIFEEVISINELYRRFTLEVSGCRQLRFEWRIKEGDDVFGDSGGVFGLGDAYVALTEEALEGVGQSEGIYFDRPVKMISELGVLGVVSQAEQAVFNGSIPTESFSMGGIKYGEGVVLQAQNNVLATKYASAAFNLDGKYDTVSFIAGHISNSNVYENDELEIYADGKLIKTIEVVCHMIPREYVIDVSGCRHLEFVSGKLTNSLMERPIYGIANLIAYPDGYVETNLFPKRSSEDYDKTCDLIDTFGFYEVYSSHIGKQIGSESPTGGYYDGTNAKNVFRIGNKTYQKGVLLKTNLHLSLDMGDIPGAGVLGTTMGGWDRSILTLSGTGEVRESAFAMANIKNSGYTSVTFTVALQEALDTDAVEDATLLMICADEKNVGQILLDAKMKPTTYTVELGEECERLMLWLDCSPDGKGSQVYAIYDIKLNK